METHERWLDRLEPQAGEPFTGKIVGIGTLAIYDRVEYELGSNAAHDRTRRDFDAARFTHQETRGSALPQLCLWTGMDTLLNASIVFLSPDASFDIDGRCEP